MEKNLEVKQFLFYNDDILRVPGVWECIGYREHVCTALVSAMVGVSEIACGVLGFGGRRGF